MQIEADRIQVSPLPVGLTPPAAPLPFFRYVRTVQANALAGFHQDVYDQSIVETKRWRLHTFIVNDPAGIRHVLVDNAENYVKGSMEPRISAAWFEKGFVAEGARPRERRRTMSSSFDYRSVLENSAIILNSAQTQLAKWDALPPGTVIEVSEEMAALSLEIISRIIFSSDSAEMAPIMERVFRRTQAEIVFDLLDFAPLLDRPWNSYKRSRVRRIFAEMDAAIERLVAKRTGQGAHAGDDLLGRLIREKNAETGLALSPREIRGQIITVIGAGHQSVALSLGWIWYLLSQHPLHEARLHAELAEVLAGRTPSPEDLPRLSYLRMIIDESLRLYPPFPAMAWRGAIADDEVCGVRIPKGSTVSIVPWVLHRHTKLWDHPGQFDPERFLPERSKERSRYAYLPFGVGPRVCIGAAFAITQMMLILATLAPRFRLRMVPGHVVEPQGLVSLRSRDGWKMTLERGLPDAPFPDPEAVSPRPACRV
jgi:cytochrome P450